MRLIVSGMSLLVALFLIAPVGDAFAPKESGWTPAAVTFRDWAGNDLVEDGITADSDAPFVEGYRNSVCRLYTGGSQDLTIGTFSSGRTIHFFYTPATDVTQPTSNPPSGSLVDNAFMNIRNIAAMQVNTRKVTRAMFTTAVGHFRWLAAPPSSPNESPLSYGSQAVVVERISATQWTVHTPEPADSDSFPGITAGDLGVLLRDAKGNMASVPVGLYHMPFALTVTCPGCVAPAP